MLFFQKTGQIFDGNLKFHLRCTEMVKIVLSCRIVKWGRYHFEKVFSHKRLNERISDNISNSVRNSHFTSNMRRFLQHFDIAAQERTALRKDLPVSKEITC